MEAAMRRNEALSAANANRTKPTTSPRNIGVPALALREAGLSAAEVDGEPFPEAVPMNANAASLRTIFPVQAKYGCSYPAD